MSLVIVDDHSICHRLKGCLQFISPLLLLLLCKAGLTQGRLTLTGYDRDDHPGNEERGNRQESVPGCHIQVLGDRNIHIGESRGTEERREEGRANAPKQRHDHDRKQEKSVEEGEMGKQVLYPLYPQRRHPNKRDTKQITGEGTTP